MQEYLKFYKDLPFPVDKTPHFRYFYNQEWFCYADAIFLYSFLRMHLPKKIIEVGSGFSSAVILDTVENFYPCNAEITFIEPNPDRLMSIMKKSDRERNRIITTRLQEISLELFDSLGPGDLLFIDSSHVVKCASDLYFLMFNVLPNLPDGIFIHFHDVFFPFEYPSQWLLVGRFWNEAYFLRAYLAYNKRWSIYFFNHYVALTFHEFLQQKMPLCLKNTGGSLYIRRNDTNE